MMATLGLGLGLDSGVCMEKSSCVSGGVMGGILGGVWVPPFAPRLPLLRLAAS